MAQLDSETLLKKAEALAIGVGAVSSSLLQRRLQISEDVVERLLADMKRQKIIAGHPPLYDVPASPHSTSPEHNTPSSERRSAPMDSNSARQWLVGAGVGIVLVAATAFITHSYDESQFNREYSSVVDEVTTSQTDFSNVIDGKGKIDCSMIQLEGNKTMCNGHNDVTH